MEFRILGTLNVLDAGRPVDLPRAKPRALLAMLVIHHNQVVSTTRLIDALWGDQPPPSATTTMHGYVSYLRHVLGGRGPGAGRPAIGTRAPGYILEVEPDWIDAQQFERLVADGRRALASSDASRAVTLFERALSLWRGPALADVAGEAFASLEAARLDELRLAAMEQHAEAGLVLGRHHELVGRLQAMVTEHPLRERLWAQLMLALYRDGRQAEALRAYQSARRRLGEELGIDPGPDLRRLEADILGQAEGLRWEPRRAAPAGTAVPFPTLLSIGSETAYVGRADLLASLASIRQQAFSGGSRAILLGGEPGVGKTRTVGEVARSAYADGAMVLYGHCDEDVAVPYQPFVEMLDWYIEHTVEPSLGRYPAELTRLQPLLAARVDDLPDRVSSDPRSEEYLLLEAATSWLVGLAGPTPLVLVVDDLHWASKPVLVLLRHLLRAAASDPTNVRMLVMGTYRDDEITTEHPIAGLLAERWWLGPVERVTLAGLFPAEVEQFVCQVVGRDSDGQQSALAQALHRDTQGNPFFMHEVLRHLVETAGTSSGALGLIRTDGGTPVLPLGVRDAVGRRLRRLTEPTRRLLSTAAVLGQEFDVGLLAAVSDLPENELLDALDRAGQARLIEEAGADHYRFAHALVRATLVEELSATRRRRLHRRIAEILEKLRPDDVIALAHHFTRSGAEDRERTRAVRYSLAAAERALATRALAEAEARFTAVLSLLHTSAGHHAAARTAAMCGLGEAQRDQGDARFRLTLLEAAKEAQACGDVALLVRSALGNSRQLPSVIGGVDAERVAITEAALAAVGPGPSAERALLLAQLAAEVTFTRDDRRRLGLADAAESMARQLGDDGLLARVLNRTGYAAFSAGRVDQLVARGAEAAALSDATGDPAQRVLARFFWSGALLTAGDLATFRVVTKEMVSVAGQAAPTFQWLALASQVRLCQIDGDVEAARRLNDEAFQRAQEIGEPDGAAWWTATDTVLALYQSRLPGPVAEALRMGMDLYPSEPAWSIGYAMSLAMEGQVAAAREVLAARPADPTDLVDHVFPFLNATMCGVIAFHLEDAELAALAGAALGPHLSAWAHHFAGTTGPIGLQVALCAATTGDLDGAIDVCEQTEDALRRAGGHGPLPRFQVYYAEILRRRGSARDRERAICLATDARDGAHHLGAPELVAVADQLVAELRRDESGTGG